MNANNKKKILITLPVSEKHKGLFEANAPAECIVYCDAKQVSVSQVSEANIIIGHIPVSMRAKAKNLEWLQLQSAGTDGYTDGALKEGVILTSATGSYGIAISEHMLGMVLALQKKFHLYFKHQSESAWIDEGGVSGLFGATVLIIGLGDIGTEFAARCKAMGSKVIGVRRVMREKPESVDEIFSSDDIDELLPRADVVALCLPATKETFHIIDDARIRKMKNNALLINVGRGSAIDQEALCLALEEGRIAGAGLDVTSPEPLPATDRLWHAPNLLLTPHVSGGFHLPVTFERIVQLASSNLYCYLQGKEMKSVVDFSTGYRKLDS